ncbi:MAG: hypothetical protein CL565_00885 [Alphaproteobacteria bacterium]|nr:hypothetical protein [Alphaproteobacteria bacterium]|tara:strand:- start:605 stop:808 length:204 start_codon:yes stop_codon:yes gene_type:complete
MKNKLSLTLDEACTAISCGKTKIYEFLDTGKLPAKKLGRRTIILKSDLEKFLSTLDAYKAELGGHNE